MNRSAPSPLCLAPLSVAGGPEAPRVRGCGTAGRRGDSRPSSRPVARRAGGVHFATCETCCEMSPLRPPSDWSRWRLGTSTAASAPCAWAWGRDNFCALDYRSPWWPLAVISTSRSAAGAAPSRSESVAPCVDELVDVNAEDLHLDQSLGEQSGAPAATSGGPATYDRCSRLSSAGSARRGLSSRIASPR